MVYGTHATVVARCYRGKSLRDVNFDDIHHGFRNAGNKISGILPSHIAGLTIQVSEINIVV